MTRTKKRPATPGERAEHVIQANANSAIEGFYPDTADKAIQKRYVEGSASIDDLLRHAQEFAERAKKGGGS